MKAPHNEELPYSYCKLVEVSLKGSFANTKMLKNILEYHIIRHFPCNIRNEENTLPYILRKKISGYMRVKPILHSMNSI